MRAENLANCIYVYSCPSAKPEDSAEAVENQRTWRSHRYSPRSCLQDVPGPPSLSILATSMAVTVAAQCRPIRC